jgi:hypothetical protein
MIEGTKQYRGRSSTPKETPPAVALATTPSVEAVLENAPALPPATPEDVPASPARREWFRSLVPAFGNGLVELLRASNNLKRDLSDAAQRQK